MMFAVRMSSVKVGKTSMRKCTVKEKRKTRSRDVEGLKQFPERADGGGGRMEGKTLGANGTHTVVCEHVGIW